MEFTLSSEKEMLRQMVAEFMQNECSPEYIRRCEEEHRFPSELWQKVCDLGLAGLMLPEDEGGSGGDELDLAIVVEELARVFPDLAFAYVINVSIGVNNLHYFGTPEQRRRYLPDFCAGKAKFALALTEPGGGTDVLGAMRTTAVRRGDRFILNGQKSFISGAHVADYLVVIARTDSNVARKSQGISVFLVDARSPGISIRPLQKMGYNAVTSNEVFFDEVSVPAENLLGEEGRGWYHLLDTLNNERIAVAAQCLGIARGCLDEALGWAKNREAFGRPIGQYQAVQHHLADMATEIELMRLITYKAAWLQSQGLPCGMESTMAKLYASEVANRVAALGMQVMGGMGYTNESNMQRFYRDVRLFPVAPITNEMARNFIAQSMGLPKSY